MLPTSSKAAVQLLPMLRPNDLQRSLRRRQVAAQPVHRLDKRGRQFGIQPALVSVTVGKKQSELDRIVDDGLQRAAKTLQGHVSVHCRWLLPIDIRVRRVVSSRSLTAFLLVASSALQPSRPQVAGAWPASWWALWTMRAGCRRQGVLVGRGRGEMYGHECADAVRKNPPTSGLSPQKRLEGSSGGLQRDKPEVPVVSDFSGRAPGGENARGLSWAEPPRRPSRQQQRRRCRQKSLHTMIYTCVLYFVQYG
jgi:hypothetical protein